MKRKLSKGIMTVCVLVIGVVFSHPVNLEAQTTIQPPDLSMCQFIDRPEVPGIDGCKMPSITHYCVCE
ncbi:hypothetical protein MM239_19815 [Belliella sp. DSM 111904]|uniref:Uncharacterized protein n=1 Tax=Belliella filtrata TaxID=2923435 RepID=A0ABS9V5I9_9BACT|nr:hypothetical protein [Belliella filtrata]MCH7411643.1 hypothetical protein [Belliella filtrata]